ncbi:MAG: ORF6N domain-containing protein [Desulfobacteraceae bacterium]|nr:MAG: ORF6N domain-containing protein [Desulfobacteraceae bacterium]
MRKAKSDVPVERIVKSILIVRGQRVMLDKDLAELYGIETKVLKQSVKRSIDRFPSDFMFVLNIQEFKNLRSQIVTSSSALWGGSRYMPMVFTEQGVAMLSSVLHSRRAVEVNIAIMRVFVQLREMMAAHKELAAKLKELEGRIQDHDEQIVAIFEAMRQLMAPPETERKKIGFEVKERAAGYGKRRSKA